MALGTTVIGRVAVRVIPDTSKFGEEAATELKKETANLDAEVPVDAVLDARKMEEELRAKVRELSDRFEVRLKTTLESLKRKVAAATRQAEAQSAADPITFQAEIDSDIAKGVRRGMREAISRATATSIGELFRKGMKLDRTSLAVLRREMEEQLTSDPLKVKIKLDNPSLSQIRRKLGDAFTDSYARALSSKEWDKYTRRFSVGSDGDTSIDLKPNVVQRQIQKVRTSIFNLRKELQTLSEDVKYSVRAEVDESSLARARVALELWYQRLKIDAIKIKAVLDKKSVATVGATLAALSGGRLFKKFVSLEPFKNLDTDLPKIATLMTMFGQLTNYLISMSSDALALGRSIGAIVPAALALPGVFLATASALYAIIAPLTKFNERIPEMAKGLRRMQDSMTSAFWEQGRRGLGQLVKLLGPLTKGFTLLGSAAGKFMGALSSNVVRFIGPELIPFFTSIKEAFDSLTKAAGPIARIMANFVKMGTQYMPRLGEATRKVVERFDKFLQKSIKSGDAFKWIDRGIENFKALGGVIAGTYRILDGLSKAAEAAGGANLQSFAAALDAIQKQIKTADFQRRLVNVFRSARVAVEQMVDVAGPAVSKLFADMGDNAEKLLPRIGESAGRIVAMLATVLDSPTVGNGLIHFFDALNGALDKLAPSAKNLSKGLGGLLDVMATMLTNFAPIVEIAFGALESHADGLMKAIQEVIRNLAAGFTNLLRDLMPVIDKLAPALLKIATSVSSTLGSLVTTLGPLIAPLLGLVANIVDAFSKLPGVIQLATVAFLFFKVKALGGLGAAVALGVFRLKGLQTAFASMSGPIGTATTKIQNFATRTKAGLGNLAGAAGKLGLIGLAIGAIGSALSSSRVAPGIEQITLALEKLSKADMSGLDALADKMGMDYRGGPFLNGLNGFEAAVQNIKGEGWAKTVNEFADSLWEFVGLGGVFKSGGGKAREYFKTVEQGLLALQSTDPAKASVAFDQIAARAKTLGFSVDDLKQLMPEYAAAVERAAGQASGTFTQSADQIIAKAKEARDELNSTWSKMQAQFDLVGNKSKGDLAKQLATSRGQVLTEMRKTAEGTDREVLSKAIALNDKIKAKAREMAKAKSDAAKDQIAGELDKLLSTYQSKFGNLENILLGGTAKSKTSGSLLDQAIGSTISTAKQAEIKQSIVSPVNAAVAEAKAKAAELNQLGANVNIAPAVSAQLATARAAVVTGMAQIQRQVELAVIAVGIGAATAAELAAGPVQTAAKLGMNAVGTAVSGMARTVLKKMDALPTAMASVAGRMRKAATFSLYQAGQSVAQSFISGVRSKIPEVVAAAKAVGKAFKDNKGPIEYDRRMLIPEGKATIQGYLDGVRSMLPEVRSTAQEVTDAMASSFSNDAINRAAKSASQIKTLSEISVGTSQYVTQIGDVTIDVAQLEGVKTVDDLAKTLRRKKRQAGG